MAKQQTQPDARVRIIEADPTLADRAVVLEEPLGQLGLPEILAGVAKRSATPIPELKVVIKIDLSSRTAEAPTGTDPETAEALIDLLFQAGCTDVVLADTDEVSGDLLENRDVLARADLLGFQFVTPGGNPYDVVDLGEETESVDGFAGRLLEGRALSSVWHGAQVRIVLARNRTHAAFRFALTLHDLVGVVPGSSRLCRTTDDPGELAVEIVQWTPPDLAIIDGWISSDGHHGQLVAKPNPTGCFIAGTDALLVDWVGAMRMNLDPHCNPMTAAVLRNTGLPHPHQVQGPTAPYSDWTNVHPWLAAAQGVLSELPITDRARELFAEVDEASFPYQNPVEGRVSSWLSKVAERANTSTAALSALVGAELAAAESVKLARSWQTVSGKSGLPRLDVPLGFDPTRYGADDFDEVVTYIEPLERLAAEAKAADRLLRWRHYGGSILFQYDTVIGAPFDDFVSRVDIGTAIWRVNDYIGGRELVTRHDDEGRAVHRATRRVYLPQPNAMAWVGGLRIDVCKLEVSAYEQDRHKVWWRTVHSPNGSAVFDDGSITFERADRGRTRVRVVARQEFALPPFWATLCPERYPWLTDRVYTANYRKFWDRSIANFEATYEGRDARIGYPIGADPNEPATIEERVRILGDRLRDSASWDGVGALSRRRRPTRVDEDGFTHFSGADSPQRSSIEAVPSKIRGRSSSALRGVLGLVGEVAGAISRDMGRMPPEGRDP